MTLSRTATRRSLFAAMTFATTLLGAIAANAQSTSATSGSNQSSGSVAAVLRYLRDPSASRCPDESTLRDAVAGRLGYDPFHADAPLTIMVSITRAGRGLRARVWRESPDAPPSTPRTLNSPHLDCAELASVVALTVAIAVDPLTATGAPTPPVAPASSPPPPASSPLPPSDSTASASPAPNRVATSAAPPASTVASPAPRPAIQPTLRVDVFGTVGFQPSPTVGFLGAGGIRWSAFSVELEVAGTIPFTVMDANSVRARASLFTGAIVPCAHWNWFAACGVVAIGALRGEIESASPGSVVTPFAAVGARTALDLRLSGPWWLYVHADLLAALTPTELRLDATTVWSSFPVSGTLGAGLAVHFR